MIDTLINETAQKFAVDIENNVFPGISIEKIRERKDESFIMYSFDLVKETPKSKRYYIFDFGICTNGNFKHYFNFYKGKKCMGKTYKEEEDLENIIREQLAKLDNMK